MKVCTDKNMIVWGKFKKGWCHVSLPRKVLRLLQHEFCKKNMTILCVVLCNRYRNNSQHFKGAPSKKGTQIVRMHLNGAVKRWVPQSELWFALYLPPVLKNKKKEPKGGYPFDSRINSAPRICSVVMNTCLGNNACSTVSALRSSGFCANTKQTAVSLSLSPLEQLKMRGAELMRKPNGYPP